MAPTTATAGETPPDNSIAWQLWVGVLTTAIPATIAVALRFYARIQGRLPLRADDWLIVGSLVSVWCMAGLRFSHLTEYDLGRHTIYVEDWQVRKFKRSFLATQMFYFSTGTCTRSSILFFYRRIFAGRSFRRAIWVALALVVGYFVSCSLAAIFGCQPVSYFWNENQPGRCMNEYLFFKVNGILNLILDVMVLLLPLPMLWRLQMHWRKKFALSLIFSLGLFACLCSSFRLLQYRNPKWKSHEDPMRTFLHSSLWSSVEQNVGVVCACLPCLRLLLRPSANWGPNAILESTPESEYTETSRPYTQGSAHPAEARINQELKEFSGSEDTNSEAELRNVARSTTAFSGGDNPDAQSEKHGIWRTHEVSQAPAPVGERFV